MRLKKAIATMTMATSLMALPAGAFASNGGYSHHHSSGGGGGLINVSLGNVQACGILSLLSATNCEQYN